MTGYFPARWMPGGLWLLLVMVLLAPRQAAAQQQYLYRFDVRTGDKDSVALQEVAPMTASTQWSLGTLQRRVDLPSTALERHPDSALHPMLLVDELDLSSWPTRCMAALRYVRNDSVKPSCSAMLVGTRWALTAAHCLRPWGSNEVIIQPRERRLFASWDDGRMTHTLGEAQVVFAYIVSAPSSSVLANDIALLELDRSIGDDLGYVGLQTLESPQAVQDSLGHMLTYPAWQYMLDTTRWFNGDRAYYRRGPLRSDPSLDPPMMIAMPNGVGIPGESGSSLVVPRNGGYVTLGALSTGRDCRSRIIDATSFAAFRQRMEEPTSVRDPQEQVDRHKIFEQITVFDALGRKVDAAKNTTLSALELRPGLYCVVAISDGSPSAFTYMETASPGAGH